MRSVPSDVFPEDGPAPRLGGVTRRSFLAGVGAAGMYASTPSLMGPMSAAAAGEATVPAVPPAAAAAGSGSAVSGSAMPVGFLVNGVRRKLDLDPRTTLLDCLREQLGLTGTKKGCDHGQCGACTVHVDGRRVNSCLVLAAALDGAEVTTVEGLARGGVLHPVQEAFLAHDAYQCGYCTSGQIMSAIALLSEPCGPDDADVKECMSGNICRCGAYQNIVAAVQQVRRSKA